MDTKVPLTQRSRANFSSSLFSLCSTWRPLSPSFKPPHRSHPAVKETTRSLLTLQLSTFAVQLSPLLSQVGAHTDSVGGRLKPAQKVKGLPTGSGQLSTKGNNEKTPQKSYGRVEIGPYLKSDCFALCGFFLAKNAANSLPVLAYESWADGSVALRLFFTSKYSIRRTCVTIKQQVSDISGQVLLQFYSSCTGHRQNEANPNPFQICC